MNLLRYSLICLSLLFCMGVCTRADSIIGMRVDPAYLYQGHFKAAGVTDAASAAQLIITDAKRMGVNCIFFYVYNSQFGAFYPTNYPDTEVEPGFGKQDILKHLLARAQENHIQVVAVTPINNFFTAWRNHPQWRLHVFGKYNIMPVGSNYILSAWNPQFRPWVMGFLKDILARYPQLSGVEVVEPQIDPHWQLASIIKGKTLKNLVAGSHGKSRPGETFIRFHARGLTRLLAETGQLLHSYGKKFYISQSWTVNSKGKLIKSAKIRESSGFDFDAILNLPRHSRPDYLIVEMIWQQWRETHNKKLFTPQWTVSAIRQCRKKISGKVKLIAHVEVTPWKKVIPTGQQFRQSLRFALNANRTGISFYDYSQIKKLNLKISL